MSVSQTHFPNAHHFEVNNGHFTNINTTIINENDAVFMTLWPHVAAGAMFDSAARHAAGKCHPGTRKKIIDKMTGWIDEYDAEKRLLWLYGPAGAGKSALAHTICERLRQSNPDLYGGSFFFASGHRDQGNAHKLFATLSYQLAVNFPQMRKEINGALAHDPSLPTKSMEVQLFSLIVQPLLRCQDSLAPIPVLIVDGLDECDETEGSTQSDIIALMAKYIFNHDLRLRFLIASRPEWWIREAFQTPSMTNITLSLSLRDDTDADEDIRMYLTDGFEKIRLGNQRIMGSVTLPWPTTNVLDDLVYEASGQYIYASTILKFVGNSSRHHNPQKQLEIITTSGPHRASAFSELDALYARILSAYPQWETMKRVLAAHLLTTSVHAPIVAIQTVLHIDHDEFLLVLDALSALIDIRNIDAPMFRLWEETFGNLQDGCEIIALCHRSFGEFLQDPSRSGSFHINLKSDPVPDEILNECFTMINRNMDQKYQVDPSVFLGTNLATYTCIKAMLFPSARHCNFETLVERLTKMTATLQRFDCSEVACMNSLFDFINDAQDLGDIVGALFKSDLLTQRKAMDKPERLDELQAAGRKFKEVLKLALHRAFCMLPLCIDFEATPALVYLLEYYQGYEVPLEQLSTLAGVSDAKATMKQYCRAVWLRYSVTFRSWVVPTHLTRLFEGGDEPRWRIEGVWRDIRVILAHEILKLVLDDCQGDDKTHVHTLYSRTLMEFFDTQSISDIQTFEYFQNSPNLAMLPTISALATWVHQFRLRNTKPYWEDTRNETSLFITWNLSSIFYWINRQLTNPQTITLLRGHDETLQETLTTFANDLFEYFFRRSLLEHCSKTGLSVYRYYSSEENEAMSIKIEVRLLPRGLDKKIMDHSYASHNHDALQPYRWHRFHNETFGNPTTDGSIPTKPIIDPLCWHPYLACSLLKVLVSFLYGQIFPDFSRERWHRDEESFPYLIPCMPYAHPTPDNLDALRAVVYLYPQVNPPWTPPEGLWRLFVEFLQKYDRSVLSSEELDLFVKWLNSEDHTDIKTYVSQ